MQEPKDLARVDLNLLLSLQYLLEERSVSRAADRMYITQPAMSKALSRLRDLFDDPLFTRASHGMQPTPRALELSAALGAILGDIGGLLTDPAFDPATSRGDINFALSEYIGAALLPGLIGRLSRKAPHLNIRVITRVENQLQELSSGNLDFAIHIRQKHYGEDYRVETLGGSPPTLLVREGHPLVEGDITFERLAEYPLIRLYISDWEQLEIQRHEAAMTPLENHPKGILEISHLLTALEVVRETDYFMPAPAYILQNPMATAGICGLTVPPEANFTLDYALVSHMRTAHSPMHNWLWNEIVATIRELRTTPTSKIRQRLSGVSASSGPLNHQR